jgi:prefoldin subunit 5
MAKESMAWHHKSLRQREEYLRRGEQEAFAMLEQLDQQRQRVERYRAQVERAQREGRDGFDEDRFPPKKGGE